MRNSNSKNKNIGNSKKIDIKDKSFSNRLQLKYKIKK